MRNKCVAICKACNDKALIILSAFYIINMYNDLHVDHMALPSRCSQFSGSLDEEILELGQDKPGEGTKKGNQKDLSHIWFEN